MTYNWETDTYYPLNSIIYPSDDNGFYYIAVKEGNSSSKIQGYSSDTEPKWGDKTVIEGNLIWKRIFYKTSSTVKYYSPNTLYIAKEEIVPSEGPIEISGGLYSYKLHKIETEPDWPIVDGETVVDNEVIWETHISTYSFIPRKLRKDKIYKEFYLLLDHLLQNPNLSFNNVLHKYKDRTKIDLASLQDFISAQGYDYIVEVLNLTKQELQILTEYLNLIHLLKGTKEGLKLVFNLLGIIYVIEEWWEKDPKDEPHTFTLEIEFDLGNVKRDSVSRIAEFVSHYVFPKMKSIIVNYNAQLASLNTSGIGVIDSIIYGEVAHNAFVNFDIFAHIETTIKGETIVPDLLSIQVVPDEVVLLPVNKQLLII